MGVFKCMSCEHKCPKWPAEGTGAPGAGVPGGPGC